MKIFSIKSASAALLFMSARVETELTLMMLPNTGNGIKRVRRQVYLTVQSVALGRAEDWR